MPDKASVMQFWTHFSTSGWRERSIKTFDTRSDPGPERAFNVSMERAPTRGWKKCRTLHYRSFVWHFFFDTFWMQRILKSVAWKCHENQFTLPFSTYRNLTIASTLPPSARPPLSLPRRDPALTIARMRLRNLMKSILKSVAEKGHENEFALQFLGYQNLIIASKKRHPLCRIWNFSFLSEKRRFQFLCCFCVKREIGVSEVLDKPSLGISNFLLQKTSLQISFAGDIWTSFVDLKISLHCHFRHTEI